MSKGIGLEKWIRTRARCNELEEPIGRVDLGYRSPTTGVLEYSNPMPALPGAESRFKKGGLELGEERYVYSATKREWIDHRRPQFLNCFLDSSEFVALP